MKHSLLLLLTVALLASCGQNKNAASTDTETVAFDNLLKGGHLDEARQKIAQGLSTATDSDSYYRYMVMQAKYYFATMNADSFTVCNRRLADYLAHRKGRPSVVSQQLEVECEMQRGVYESRMTGNMQKAIEHYQKALDIIDGSKDPELRAQRLRALFNLADAYKQESAYDQAVDYYRRTLELGDKTGMSTDLEIALNIGIASAYAGMHSFDQSAVWWEKASALYDQMSLDDQFVYLNNRGNDLYLQKRYDECLHYLLRLDSIMDHQPDMVWEHMFCHANLADVYLKLDQLDEAHAYYDDALAFFSQQHLVTALYYLHTQHIEMAMKEGRLKEALELVKNDTTAQDYMIPEQVLLRQGVLIKLYQKTGLWQQASLTEGDLYNLIDSIANNHTKMRFSTALIDYEHDKQLQEKEQEVREHKAATRRMVTHLLVATVIIVLLLIILVLLRRQRKLREMAVNGTIANLRMEAVRNRITPHFMSNALSAEMLAQMEGRPVDLDALVQLLHRGIEMSGTEQITLHDELEFIRFFCKVESRSVGDDFRLAIDLAPDVDDQHVMLPSMLIQIMVENAIKHGLKAKPRREGHYRQVTVKASRRDGGTLVEVIDNGIGLPTADKRKDHTGLTVVRKTIQLLNEQQLHTAGRNSLTIDFSVEDYTHPNGETGARSQIFLPDNFKYKLVDNTFSFTHTNTQS